MRVVGLVVLGALILAGCGGGERSSGSAPKEATPKQVRAEIERVWNDVFDALRAGDGARICSHATAGYARQLAADASEGTCAEAASRTAKLVNADLPATATLRYSAFSHDGDRAAIRVSFRSEGHPFRNDVRFRFVDGEWKFDRESGLGSG